MKFWIDIDDTLANTDETVLKIAADYQINVLKKPMPQIKPMQSKDHNYFMEVMGWTMPETMGFLQFCYPQCLADVKIKPGAAETLAWLQKCGHEFNILSSRVNAKGEDALDVTKNWIAKNNLHPDSITIACKDKGEYLKNEAGIFIDDAYDHAGAACENPNLTVFQINSHFVMPNPDKRIHHFTTWNELPEILRKMFPGKF